MLNSKLAKELLGAEKDTTKRHPLLRCIFTGDKIPKDAWSKELLNIEDEAHWTPLTAMVALHRLNEIPEGILTRETLNTPNSRGWTPLHRTIVWGYAAEVNYLIDQGADPTIKTPEGKSCVELCVDDSKGGGGPNKTILKILGQADIKKKKKLIKKNLIDIPITV